MKRVLIIFDTQFGNTRKLAFEIATGIQKNEGIATNVIDIHALDTEDLSIYTGVLLGGPTRAFRATRGAMNAIKKAGKLGLAKKVVSTFGTYMVGNQSRGVKGMDKKLRIVAKDSIIISPGFSAKVDGPTGPISSGEIDRAHGWGKTFGQEVLNHTPHDSLQTS